MLGLLDEASGLLAAARAANHGELRPQVLVRHARAVNPMLRVLTGLPRADRWVEVGSVLMRRILDTAAMVSDLTVVDTGFSLEVDEELSYDTAAPRRNGATVEVLARADLVVAVGGADPVSLGRLVARHPRPPHRRARRSRRASSSTGSAAASGGPSTRWRR